MRERKEDDDGNPRSANDSMRTNPLANQPDHVELSKYSRFQLKLEKGSGVSNGIYHPTIYYMLRPFSERYSFISRWFL